MTRPPRRVRRALQRTLRRLVRREDGNATIEFAILFPLLAFTLISSVELGLITVKSTMLERALDMTVRDIRLSTGTAPQHDEIKALICERGVMLKNCNSSLRLEMVRLDPRNWSGPPAVADCVDTSDEVAPVREFVHGRENEMMFLRACVKIDPIFPTAGLGSQLAKDGAGQYALVATSAFVQEPR
jgi:Flp pilus assembly pilin Flp